MAEDRSLLAYLVPKITNRREDTATDALAFILNKSEDCRKAFNDLLRGSGYDLDAVGNFQTQVDFGDGHIPDMVGYDEHRNERLIVEAKFWASLRHGQTKGYFCHLEKSGTGVLLYIAPGARMETLWGGNQAPHGRRWAAAKIGCYRRADADSQGSRHRQAADSG